MGVQTLVLLAMLVVPGPQAVRSLAIHNPHDHVVKVRVWDYARQTWTAPAPLVLNRDGRGTPTLAPGRYQLVFESPDGVLVHTDTEVRLKDGTPFFVQRQILPVTSVARVVDPAIDAPVPRAVTSFTQIALLVPVFEVPDFPAPRGP